MLCSLKVGALAQIGRHQRRVFLGQQPGLHALRLRGDRVQHLVGLGPPVGTAERDHAHAEGVRLGLGVDEAIDHFAERPRAFRACDRRAGGDCRCSGTPAARTVPGLVAGLAQDPVDDRLLGAVGRRDARRVGADVVVAPLLAVVGRQRVGAARSPARSIARGTRRGAGQRLGIGRRDRFDGAVRTTGLAAFHLTALRCDAAGSAAAAAPLAVAAPLAAAGGGAVSRRVCACATSGTSTIQAPANDVSRAWSASLPVVLPRSALRGLCAPRRIAPFCARPEV